MKKNKYIFALLAVSLLVACTGVRRSKASKEITVYLADGSKETAYLITAPDGQEYYACFKDSVNYQQALELQYGGWVLPRMYGPYAMDEHRRCTSVPRLEELFDLTLDEDLPPVDEDRKDPDKVMRGRPTRLTDIMRKRGMKEISLWSGTRFPGKKGTVYNYGLSLSLENTDITLAQYGIAGYEEKMGALLLMRAALMDNGISDHEYYVNDGMTIPSLMYTAADGYDYFVVCLCDSLYTWYEALNMEHDGWLLPRTEGRYSDARGREREVAYWRLHSKGLEPTIEGLSGRHPFVNIEKLSRVFEETFPQPCWTGTPCYSGDAYMFGSKYHYRVGNLNEYDRNEKAGGVFLLKRVQPGLLRFQPEDSPLSIQPMRVQGASGKVYHVVDPLGWRGFGCTQEEAVSLEQPDWHIITVDELGDMLGGMFNESMLPFDYAIEMDHPLLHTLFPRNAPHNYYYVRTSDGELQSFYTRMNSTYFCRSKVSSFFYWSSYVRLVYNGDW
ncbi:MAG: hypothetical protein J5669_02890 [Bacteroidales bacterium]|nr:hypothetical protein [Bacteroidales bacterium]